MKSIYITFLSLFLSLAYSQERKVYTFFVELNHYSKAPEFKKSGDKLTYVGTDIREKDFFSKYTILEFYQAFPDSEMKRTLNMFTVVTYDKDLMIEMNSKFPEKYIRIEDLSNIKIKLLNSYPNDYGTTSPLTNSGAPLNFKNYDYINVPKAWDYTYGKSEVIIGILDTAIDTSDIDFKYKTQIVSVYSPYNPPYSLNNSSWHGTAVSAIAAAQGNNSHGMTGICSNCNIIFSQWTYGSPGTATNPLPNTNRLLQMAKAGARVINMSWLTETSTTTAPIITYQWIFDEIHDLYNTVLVAGAGNESPWSVNPSTGILYVFPASYNHVISVSSVNHKNNWGEEVDNNFPVYGEISRFVADQISPSVVTNYNGNGPHSFTNATDTVNDKVDICAPGYQIAIYPRYVFNGVNGSYGDGTSVAAPHVTGTIGLMLSLNKCLLPDEVEDILQLTSKNLENIVGNESYAGKIGSGKLETGDAVEFVDKMMKTNGNAVIDGQDFYRFNFDLKHINNKLTIANQIFRDNCTASFTAKNVIEVLPGSDFKPNSNGFVDLKTDATIIVTCTIVPKSNMADRNDEQEQFIPTSLIKLYPNPNNGTFEISLGREIKEKLNVEVYDIYGKAVYKGVKEGSLFTVDIPNLSTGMYIVKISSGFYNETIKFIKE